MSRIRTLHVLALLVAEVSLGAALAAPVGASVSTPITHSAPRPAIPAAPAPSNKTRAAREVAGAGVRTGGAGRPKREIFGFAFGNSSLDDPNYGISTWSFSLLSTVAYFGLNINWDGTIIQSGAGWTTWNSSTLTNLVSTAHSNGTRVILSVNLQDFNGSPVSTMCAALHPLHRSVTVSQTIAQVQKMHLDGVNLDYEGLNATCAYGPTTRSEMTSLTAEMSAALPHSYLSVDTYSGSAGDPYNFYDVPGMARYVDSFFVMAYDMEYSNQNRAPLNCPGNNSLNCLGPTSPLTSYYYNDTDVMAQYVSAAGANKVILGVPYYGRKSCVASATANAISTSTVSADSYLDASSESTDPSVQPGSYATHRDAYDGTERWDTWYSTKLGCIRELYWDDAYSIGRKYDLVNNLGLRGAGIFALQYGAGAPELWNLLAAHFTNPAPPLWAVEYDASGVPTSWTGGQTQLFTIFAKNTGNQTWPSGGANYVALDLHFAPQPGAGSYAWLTSQVFSLSADVAPGQTAQIPVRVTAPQQGGSMYLETQMFKNQQFWFQASQPVVVAIAQQWSVGYDVSGIPAAWSAGQTQVFTVFAKNTGTQTWPSGGANYVALDLHFATQPGAATSSWLTSLIFRISADVAPGQYAQIPVRVTAPQQTGAMYLEATLFQNQRFWFQSFQPVVVTVGNQQWSSGYDLSGIPTSWTAGQTQNFTIFARNTGTQTWPSSGAGNVALDLHFSSQPGGSGAMNSWLTSQIFSVPADIAPGQTAQIPVSVTAPQQAGALYLEAEMFKNHQFWFPQAQPVAVMASPGLWWSDSDLSGVPAAWTSGQTQAFTVFVKNTGNQTWPAGGANYVALDLHFTTAAGGSDLIHYNWLTSQIFSLPTDIAPGQTAQIPVKVTAPAQTGYLYLEAQVFKNQQFWMQPWQPVAVTIS